MVAAGIFKDSEEALLFVFALFPFQSKHIIVFVEPPEQVFVLVLEQFRVYLPGIGDQGEEELARVAAQFRIVDAVFQLSMRSMSSTMTLPL